MPGRVLAVQHALRSGLGVDGGVPSERPLPAVGEIAPTSMHAWRETAAA